MIYITQKNHERRKYQNPILQIKTITSTKPVQHVLSIKNIFKKFPSTTRYSHLPRTKRTQ